MNNTKILRTLGIAGCVSGCAALFSAPAIEPLRFASEVEYIEVGRLIAASENVLVPLGPGRSYWFNASDGSRWASEFQTVPPSTRVVILQDGLGVVGGRERTHLLRHVGGPRIVKRGWFDRVVDEYTDGEGVTEVAIQDGRRFQVAPTGRAGGLPIPYEVLVSEDTTRIFVLRNAAELRIVRELEF